MSEGMESLDFTGAKEVTFEPLPNGTYECVVLEAEMGETSGTGKLGVRPKLSLTFKVTDDEANPEEYHDRRIWTQFTIPPKELDGAPYKDYDTMMGNLLGFFKAIGYTEQQIRKWKKLPSPDDYLGKPCSVVAKYVPPKDGYNAKNEVRTVKPAGSTPASAAAGGLDAL